MKISVCIPCYNVENYIGECLESLLNQTLKEIEIICVDDCSTDRTLAILTRYAKCHNNIKVYRNLFNSKLIQTRKVALSHAFGNYIMFVDSDDILERNACEIAYNAIVKNNSDIVEFNCKQIDINGKEINEDKSYCNLIEGKLAGDAIFENFKNNKIGQMLLNKIYKSYIIKSDYLQISFSRLYYKEDVFLTSIIYNNIKSYYGIPDKLYKYRLHSGQSRASNITLEQFKDRCKCADIISDMIKCFYSQSDLTLLQLQMIKSKMNNWLKNSNLEELLKHKGEDGFDDYLTVFINAWINNELYDRLQYINNEDIKDIYYTQLRLVLECLHTIYEQCGSEVIKDNQAAQNLCNRFSACKKYNIDSIVKNINNDIDWRS